MDRKQISELAQLLICAVGLGACIVLNVWSIFGNPHLDSPGVIIIFIALAISWGQAISVSRDRYGGRRGAPGRAFERAPMWMKILSIVLILYGISQSVMLGSAGARSASDPVTSGEIRRVTGGFIIFYSCALPILFGGYRDLWGRKSDNS